MQHFGKAARRVTESYTTGCSITQTKIREATSRGPSDTQLREIAQLTYNQNDFTEIVDMLEKQLQNKEKNWRHVFKSLLVLEYCLYHGSENVAIYFRDNINIIKTLREFQYVDEDGTDRGSYVQQEVNDVINLLMDEDRLRSERRSRTRMQDRMVPGVNGGSNRQGVDNQTVLRRDEDEMRRAIEESKRTLAQEIARKEERELQAVLKASEEESKRKKDIDNNASHAIEERKRSLAQEMARMEEQELQAVLRASEEELKRRKDIYSSNASAPFNCSTSPSSSNSTSGGFPLFDPTPDAVGLRPQFTSIQPQMSTMPLQQQFASFNSYQQQLEQQAMQQEYIRQQQEFLTQQQAAQQQAMQQEYMRQQQEFLAQQQAAQKEAQMQAQQEEWMRQQLLRQQQLQLQQQQQLFVPQQLTAQPTSFGNNNPFAPKFQTAPESSASTSPSFNLSSTDENHSHHSNLSAASLQLTAASSSSNPYAYKTPNIRVPVKSKNEARLEHLFANRDDDQKEYIRKQYLQQQQLYIQQQLQAQQQLKRRKDIYGSNANAPVDDAAPRSNSDLTPGASPLINPTPSCPVPDVPRRFPMNLAGPPLQESENLAKFKRADTTALPGPPIRER
ncbi:hypothetical protein H1R20_g3879, partial [Candolleomyces eurysporus]